MYEYLTLATQANRWDRICRFALNDADWQSAGRVTNLGVFTPQIGASINRVILLNKVCEAAARDGISQEVFSHPGIVSSERIRLHSIAERSYDLLEPDEAIFTHRWFLTAGDDDARFEELTVGAWDEWERDTDCKVVGLWKAEKEMRGHNAYFLMARYPTLAHWGNSRFWASPIAQNAEKPGWVELLSSRREITMDTWVTTNRLVGVSGR